MGTLDEALSSIRSHASEFLTPEYVRKAYRRTATGGVLGVTAGGLAGVVAGYTLAPEPVSKAYFMTLLGTAGGYIYGTLGAALGMCSSIYTHLKK
jgi:hypothetical protein